MCIFKKKQLSFSTGLIPSPTDSRDIPLSAIQIPMVDLPDSYRVPYKLRVSFQNGFPHCVGYAGATMKEEKEMREQKVMEFDGDWLYRKCKEFDGMPDVPGTFFRMALQVMKNVGAKPLNSDESEASKYRIGAYAKVDDTSFAGLKSAIIQNGVVLAGYRGSNAGWSNAYVRPPREGEEIWGHAVSLIGWNKDYLIGQNSWGTGWGEQGIFYISPNYPPLEVWATLVDLPDDFVRPPKPIHMFTRDLVYKENSPEVVWLQKCLKWEGTFPEIIDCTGYYGTITKRAVEQFQAAHSLRVTGLVNSETRVLLNSIFG